MSYVQYTNFVNAVATIIATYYEDNHSISVDVNTLVAHVLANENIDLANMTPSRLTASVATKSSTIRRPRTSIVNSTSDGKITCGYIMAHGKDKGQLCGKVVSPENIEKGRNYCNSCLTKSGPRKALGLEPIARKQKVEASSATTVDTTAPKVPENASAGTKVVSLKSLNTLRTYKPTVETEPSLHHFSNFNLELALDDDKYNVVGTDVIVIKRTNGDIEAVDYLDEKGEPMGFIPSDKMEDIIANNIIVSSQDKTTPAREIPAPVVEQRQLEAPKKFSAPKPGFGGLTRLKTSLPQPTPSSEL
jgi:hypothetical protein